MGHAGMAATAVRYLRSVGAATTAEPPLPEELPRPDLRAVRDDERLPVDPAEFRRVLGNFASGVTVVTARDADGPTGFACQSFASLSLDPPLVAFMVARTSTTWPRIARAGSFCVNILGSGQGALCRGFAVSGADKFAGVAYGDAPGDGVTAARLRTGLGRLPRPRRPHRRGPPHRGRPGGGAGGGGGGAEGEPLLFHRGLFGRFSR
ncbi:Flavin reductase family protein OS=Streptomyces microflavus OX=1919 GN=G3I39_05440 PE=3 SV=1 [Streptomyces microflavus]